MRLAPYPYRARAWWGEAVVADSNACVRLERVGEPALLYFPRADIDLSTFRPDRSVTLEPEGGEAQAWTATPDADAVLTLLTAPGPGFEELRDHGRFDPDRARVEVLDGDLGARQRAHGEALPHLGRHD